MSIFKNIFVLTLLMLITAPKLKAQNDSLRKALIVAKAGWIEYCYQNVNSEAQVCNEFISAAIEGEDFVYSGKQLGHKTYRRFRAGNFYDKPGDCYHFASGRLVMLNLNAVEKVNAIAPGSRIKIAFEDVYTIDLKLESRMLLYLNIPDKISEAELKELLIFFPGAKIN